MFNLDVLFSYLVFKAEMLSAGSRTEVTRVTEREIVRTVTAGALLSPPNNIYPPPIREYQ